MKDKEFFKSSNRDNIRKKLHDINTETLHAPQKLFHFTTTYTVEENYDR